MKAALGASSALLLGSVTASPAEEPIAVLTSIGNSPTIDAATLLPAVRLAVPQSLTADPPLPVLSNQSGCRSDLPHPVMTLTIADIAYACPVYAGGQAMIDAGAATLVSEAGIGSLLATSPGAGGTMWLAGHRSSHGAAFASVPTLADGAIIVVSAGTLTASYRVVGRARVEIRDGTVIDASGAATAGATLAALVRADGGGEMAPRLVLQTCDGANARWMIYADVTTG